MIFVDSGFLRALAQPTDALHERAQSLDPAGLRRSPKELNMANSLHRPLLFGRKPQHEQNPRANALESPIPVG